jgi:hypothetical protein
MCDDVNGEVSRLEEHRIACEPVSDQAWGRLTCVTLPSGAQLGLYEPRHPMAISR